MKRNRLFITVAAIVAGSFLINISAQDALKAIAKKCETLENVDVSVVRNRNKETKKVEMYIMSVNIKNNESVKKEIVKENDALKKEILAAFEKDRINADQEVEDRKNGKIRELLLRFGSSSYTFSESHSGNFSFSVIEDYGNKDGVFLNYGFYPYGARPLQAQVDMAMKDIESIDWEGLSKNLEKRLENLNGELKINMKNLENKIEGLDINFDFIDLLKPEK